MFGASKTASGSNLGPSDPYYEYVTMLLTGDGTNGAQNNTFIDSSSNNFTITRNGNTTQGSFTPYGPDWSNYFLSSATSYLDIAGGSTLALGTGDFTIEFWINPASYPQRIFGWTVQSDASFGSEIDASGHVWFGGWTTGNTSVSTITLNVWTHLAYTRASGVERLFINGVLDSSATRSTNYSSTANLSIGRWANTTTPTNGYISNFRLIKGTALYTSSFAPSTTPLTAVSGTQLLTCQSNRFIDNSSNAFAITVNGTPSVQRFSPFNPTVPYSTATIGGSGYFDGTGDYLSIANNAAIQLGTTYTIEGWFYTNTTTTQRYFGKFSSGVGGWLLLASSTDLTWFFASNGAYTISATVSIPMGAWNHIAIATNGSTMRIWLNGTSVGSYSSPPATQDDGNALRIGSYNGVTGGLFNGYISNFRIVNGSDVYGVSNTTITVPTAPLTAITNTSLLCNMTNAGIPDSAMMNDLETAGNAQVSTSVKKYGTGSIYKTNATDANYLVTQNISTLNFAGDFTIEMWLYPLSWDDATLITFASGTGRFQMGCDGSNFGLAASGVAWYLSYGTKPSLNTWTHIAITRSGSTLRMFYDGVQVQSATTSYSFTGFTHIGGYPGAGTNYTYNGYMDDLRITNGYARYTANFTPPTTALPTY